MNNLNSITRAHPEYYILKRYVRFLETMGIEPDTIKAELRERFELNERVLGLLFPMAINWSTTFGVKHDDSVDALRGRIDWDNRNVWDNVKRVDAENKRILNNITKLSK